MNKEDKTKIIKKILKKEEYFKENENSINLMADEIIDKTSFIFKVAETDNEIFDLLRKFLEQYLKGKKEIKKAKTKEEELLDSVKDPIQSVFDITKEKEMLKNIIKTLKKLEKETPYRKYAEIFYQRYVEKMKIEEIAHYHNKTVEDINLTIVKIAKETAKLIL